MADDNKGLVAAGASLVWRRQRVLWWVFAVNFVLGLLGAAGARSQLDKILGHSLAGQSLAKGFDLGMFLELITRPEANLMRSAQSSMLFAMLFPLFMLFVTGGILAVYCEDKRFTAGEFFAASGAFFWRFVRLALFSIVPFAILGGLYAGANALSAYLGDRAIAAETGFYIYLAGVVIVALLLLFVRLWFDIAQVRAVVQDEPKMWPNLWKALGISWRNLGTLFPVYLCVSGVAWLSLALGLWLWTKFKPTWTPATFLLLEFTILLQLLTRLWQRASSVTWYRRHAEAVPADAVAFTTPPPVELYEDTFANFDRPATQPHEPSTEPNSTRDADSHSGA